MQAKLRQAERQVQTLQEELQAAQLAGQQAGQQLRELRDKHTAVEARLNAVEGEAREHMERGKALAEEKQDLLLKVGAQSAPAAVAALAT